MATVINNPNADSTAGGWSVAVIVLAIIVLGVLAFFAFGRGSLSGGGTQVNIPAVNLGTGGGSGGGTGGGSGAGTGGGATGGQ